MYNYHIGEYIKRKREEKEIKQDELCYGICDRSTLSRIERGKQEPSYYILKALLQRLGISEDRCQILMGPQEFEISELQREIIADNVRKDFSSALKKIRRLEELSQSAENPLLQQFVRRVRALAGYEENGERFAYDYPTQREMLMQALKLTHPNIDLSHISNCLLSVDEIKILNQYAITYSEIGNRRYAIHIYQQLFDCINYNCIDTESIVSILTLLAYNYSRLLGQERRYEEAVEIAELGQNYCVKYNKCQMLGGLLLNIACCAHELEDDEKSKDLLRQAYYVNKAMKQEKSCKVVEEYWKQTFKRELF